MKLEDERKNNPVPISTGNKLFFKNSRYSLEFDPNEGSYKLIINDVAKSDEGKYQCQVVTTPENVITADVDVKVKTTPVMKEDAEPVVMQEVNNINRSSRSRRKRGMAFNPHFIIPDLHFPNELCYGYLSFFWKMERKTWYVLHFSE